MLNGGRARTYLLVVNTTDQRKYIIRTPNPTNDVRVAAERGYIECPARYDDDGRPDGPRFIIPWRLVHYCSWDPATAVDD